MIIIRQAADRKELGFNGTPAFSKRAWRMAKLGAHDPNVRSVS